MANETCNTLKNQGDHCEHTDGHGEQHLSVGLATLRLLAFVVDQTQPLCCALFRAVGATLGSKRLVWERMRALCYDDRLESMREVLEALVSGVEKSHLVVRLHTSGSLSVFSRGVGRRNWAVVNRQGVGLSVWRKTLMLKAT